MNLSQTVAVHAPNLALAVERRQQSELALVGRKRDCSRLQLGCLDLDCLVDVAPGTPSLYYLFLFNMIRRSKTNSPSLKLTLNVNDHNARVIVFLSGAKPGVTVCNNVLLKNNSRRLYDASDGAIFEFARFAIEVAFTTSHNQLFAVKYRAVTISSMVKIACFCPCQS